LVTDPHGVAGPGVALRLSSESMGQALETVLLLESGQDRYDMFGLASVKWHPRLPVEKEWASFRERRFVETQVLFALAPGQPIVHTHEGPASELGFVLEKNGAGYRIRQTVPDAKRSWPLESLLQKDVALGKVGVSLQGIDYWPDFAMENGRPATKSDQPNNPAVMLRLQGTRRTAPENKPVLHLAPAENGMTAYVLTRGSTVENRGVLALNQPLATGWNDWTVTITEAAVSAVTKPEWVEADPATAAMDSAVTPGLRMALLGADGSAGPAQWLAAGSVATLTHLSGEAVDVAFGMRVHTVPFTIALEKFEVPRDPGTDQPADFISHLHFTDAVRGLSLRDTAHMNYPAMFPGGFWRSALGLNYKFSQASWNPQDLDETTLQVLYDPGWPFKWIGSLMISVGITLLFYWRPRRRDTLPTES
jgi:hypothetical protein